MSPRSVAEIAFTVTGVYQIATGVSYGVTSLAFVSPDLRKAQGILSVAPQMWLNVIGPAVFIVVGVALVAFRRRLAARFVDERKEGDDDRGTLADAQGAAVAVIGLLFLAEGVTELLRDGMFWKLGGLGGEPSVRDLCEGGARVVVGLALFFGARGIVGFWKSLRSAVLPRGT